MATLESLDICFIVRYRIDPAVFSQVLSIVTQYSVLFVGLLHGNGVEVLAQLSLPEVVDPDQTSAFLDGDRLELTIAKVSGLGASA